MVKELEEFLCQLSRQSRKSTVEAGDESFCRRDLLRTFCMWKLGTVVVSPRAVVEESIFKT